MLRRDELVYYPSLDLRRGIVIELGDQHFWKAVIEGEHLIVVLSLLVLALFVRTRFGVDSVGE